MNLPYAEPYKIKMVEPVYSSIREQREEWIKRANYNMFNLKSCQVFIDLLTDSGTSAMSDRQWAEIMLGDESYAGSSSYYKLKKAVGDIMGFEYFLPTHQGRAAENVLFSVLVKEGDVVPGNSHFDTTKGHIEFRKATAIDCTIDEAFDTTSGFQFKGNIDLKKLENVFESYPREKIPLVLITVTCNSSGGQPVSMENIKAVSKLSKQYSIPVFFDAARFAENAYFIKEREAAYRNVSIKDIVKEMFSYSEGCTMSSKKDGIVNIGGLIGLKSEKIFKEASTFNIIYEGFITYGGMAGRDMGALAVGLDEATEYDYLHSRIKQVGLLGELLESYEIPVLKPSGGHAIYIDAKRFLPHIPQSEFSAQLLAVELYLEGGIRGTEIGTLLADRDPVTRKNRYPVLELLRLAIPRRVYTDNHIRYIAAALKNVFDKRDSYKHGLKILEEAPIMRHFTVKLNRL